MRIQVGRSAIPFCTLRQNTIDALTHIQDTCTCAQNAFQLVPEFSFFGNFHSLICRPSLRFFTTSVTCFKLLDGSTCRSESTLYQDTYESNGALGRLVAMNNFRGDIHCLALHSCRGVGGCVPLVTQLTVSVNVCVQLYIYQCLQAQGFICIFMELCWKYG